MCNGKNGAISDNNIVTSMILWVEREIVEIRSEMVACTTIQKPAFESTLHWPQGLREVAMEWMERQLQGLKLWTYLRAMPLSSTYLTATQVWSRSLVFVSLVKLLWLPVGGASTVVIVVVLIANVVSEASSDVVIRARLESIGCDRGRRDRLGWKSSKAKLVID